MSFEAMMIIDQERVFKRRIKKHAVYRYKYHTDFDYGLYSNSKKLDKTEWRRFKKVSHIFNRTVSIDHVDGVLASREKKRLAKLEAEANQNTTEETKETA